MTKVEAIKKVLIEHHGIATWEIIYKEVQHYYPNVKNSKEWKSGLRGVLYREIKNNKNFKKLGLGLYALIDFKEDYIKEIQKDTERMHSYMEGVCIEIGNFLKLKTYTADTSATFNSLSLSNIATLDKIPNFTYPEILEYCKRIDVLWFNEKGYQFPKRAIEIIHSIGTLETALKRTLQLIDFQLDFYFVCKKEFLAKIHKEINAEPFVRMKNRYKVKDYDSILALYENPIQHASDDFFNPDFAVETLLNVKQNS